MSILVARVKLLGALLMSDFDKVVESSRPWEEEGEFWGEGTRGPPIRPSPSAPPSLLHVPSPCCLYPLACGRLATLGHEEENPEVRTERGFRLPVAARPHGSGGP